MEREKRKSKGQDQNIEVVEDRGLGASLTLLGTPGRATTRYVKYKAGENAQAETGCAVRGSVCCLARGIAGEVGQPAGLGSSTSRAYSERARARVYARCIEEVVFAACAAWAALCCTLLYTPGFVRVLCNIPGLHACPGWHRLPLARAARGLLGIQLCAQRRRTYCTSQTTRQLRIA